MPLFLIVEQIVNGIILGSMYALIAVGVSLIWGTMRMLNFAQGEFYMLGGFAAYYLIQLGGLSPLIGVPLAVAIVFLVAVALQRVAIQPLMGNPNWEFTAIVATLGISILLQNFALRVFGERVLSMDYFVSGVVAVGNVRVAGQRLLILATSVASAAALWLLMSKTSFGLALRATAQDRDAATLYGVNNRLVYLGTFGLAAALAALGATVLAPIFAINPWMGLPVMLKGFIVVVLGGLTSIQGAVLGGFVLGIAETLATIAFSSEWKDVASFALLIAVLWVRPWGLFGAREY